MSVAAAVYYIGAGVFNFGEGKDNKDYKYGDKLPSSLPAETLERMKKNGKASETPPAQSKAEASSELGALRDKVKELTTQLSTITTECEEAKGAALSNSDEIERLQNELSSKNSQIETLKSDHAAAVTERDEAKDALSQAQTTIEELTKAQLTVPAGAGPAKK